MDYLGSQARAAQLFHKDHPLLTGLEQVEKVDLCWDMIDNTVAHGCHGTTKYLTAQPNIPGQISHCTTKNSHGTTKYFTAQPNISRHNQKLSRQNQINNGKTKFLIRGKTEKHTQKQITRC